MEDVMRVASFGNRDCSEGAALLANAFRNNPLNRAISRAESSRECHRANHLEINASFSTALAAGRVLAASNNDGLIGLLVAAPPDTFPFPPPHPFRLLSWNLLRGMAVARRWKRVFETLAPLHPSVPHWYLTSIGVVPSHQKKGVGTQLLNQWLTEVDLDGVSAYLETDREVCISFYEKGGFRVVGELNVFGVQIWRMERPVTITGMQTRQVRT